MTGVMRAPALATLTLGTALSLTGGAAGQTSPSGAMIDEEVALTTPTGTIRGTLLIPATGGPHPVVLIIAGSGPTDRDGNTQGLPGRNDSLKLLAAGLAERGIASLRYDKRAIGASSAAGPSELELRFETYVEDAAAWVRRLREDPRFSSVSIVGHSEGALIGAMAARATDPDAYVSIAGIGRRASEVVRDQLRGQLPQNLWEESERILQGLEAGRTTEEVSASLNALYRPSVQPYLISWFRHDPAREVAALDMPVLLVQGTTDIQVRVSEAEALQAAQPNATLVILPGMNHVLKSVAPDPAAQQASYFDPSLPLAPDLINALEEFLGRATPRVPR